MDYDALAPVYERVFGPEAAESSWRALAPLLLPGLEPQARVLDLCCGTGEITARLLQAGLRVTGVDRSRAMLAYARIRAPRARFIEADLRDYHPRGRAFDAAVCAYNSLPHIMRARELGAVFGTVRRALRPGGRFVFDLYPEEAFTAGWHGAHRSGECVLEARYHRQSARATTRVYWPEGSATLRIRSYSAGQLQHLLRQAGFAVSARVRTCGREFWAAESELEYGEMRSVRPQDRSRSPGRDSSPA